MQTNTLTGAQELADFLEQSKILDIVDHGAGRMYVLEWNKQDVLAFADKDGNAFVVYPPESFDAESAGSVHDHCRACAEHADS